MRQATITREASTDQGTYGIMVCECDGETLTLQTLELPWRENRQDVSSIPIGVYKSAYGPSSKNIGGVSTWYRLQQVKGRSGVLIHPGNWAGDKSKGYASSVEGCILVGLGRSYDAAPGKRKKQSMVTQSRSACVKLVKFFGAKEFVLTIQPQPE